MSWRSFLSALVKSPGSATGLAREVGPPTSSNGASSMHLSWVLTPAAPIVEVRADIEIVKPPPSDKLVFWALQVNFSKAGRSLGAGHFGLQHHPDYPGRCAVNWGGYHSAESGRSGELAGSALAAPSALGNTNTCNYEWQAGQRYTYRISRSPEHGWRGSIIDSAGTETYVRDLHSEGTELSNPMVWTESFAHCDDPASIVRWSDMVAVDAAGREHSAVALTVNYQKVSAGGCSNTSAVPGVTGSVEQHTNTQRSVAQGTTISLT